MLSLFVLCVFMFFAGATTDLYTVPNARIEVFRPRGLRISIPDYPGVRLFAVHAVVNRELNGLEAGDISHDVLKKSGGRWVFEDKKLKLNRGDVVNYWLFVIKGHLGYRLDDQTFTVTDFTQAPNSFLNGKRTTTFAPPQEDSAQYAPLPPISCSCPEPSTTSQPTCTPPTTTPVPPTPPADLAIWRDLLVNLSQENADFRNQIAVLYENNKLLVSKLQRLGDENLFKLRIEGQLLQNEEPITIVKTILTEKLRILDTTFVKRAVRNADGTITFEMRNIDDKLLVLREAREKLTGAKFSIKDIDAISFTDKTDKVVIDVRGQ